VRRLQWSSRRAPPARLAFFLGTKNAFNCHVSQNDDEFAKTSTRSPKLKNFNRGNKFQISLTRNFLENQVLRIREILVRIRMRIRQAQKRTVRIRVRLRIGYATLPKTPTNLQKSISYRYHRYDTPVIASKQSTINVRGKKIALFFLMRGEIKAFVSLSINFRNHENIFSENSLISLKILKFVLARNFQ
jgi:hypothetical protein